MREIKFRGRDTNSKWYYGDLVSLTSYHHPKGIRYFENGSYWVTDVDPSTVGQFAGLHDKNGKEIYKGDVLADGVHLYLVEYSEIQSGFYANGNYANGIWSLWHLAHEHNQKRKVEIIGNIYDNPSLLT